MSGYAGMAGYEREGVPIFSAPYPRAPTSPNGAGRPSSARGYGRFVASVKSASTEASAFARVYVARQFGRVPHEIAPAPAWPWVFPE
jgi:hypothetical protein